MKTRARLNREFDQCSSCEFVIDAVEWQPLKMPISFAENHGVGSSILPLGTMQISK
jgi:hypothetical protein